MNLFNKAWLFAKQVHEGQLDDDGESYFQAHCAKVATIVSIATTDEEIRAAALLHDVLEDTDITYEKLRDVFGVRVANLVYEVTHEGINDSYGYYFPRLSSADAILIKLADRISNISRMGSWDKVRKQHYLNKTKFWKDGEDR